jgi:hypothetical protein
MRHWGHTQHVSELALDIYYAGFEFYWLDKANGVGKAHPQHFWLATSIDQCMGLGRKLFRVFDNYDLIYFYETYEQNETSEYVYVAYDFQVKV